MNSNTYGRLSSQIKNSGQELRQALSLTQYRHDAGDGWDMYAAGTPTHYQELLYVGHLREKKTNRGRPKEMWRRTAEKDLKSRELTFDSAPRAAADRTRWRAFAVAPSTSRRRGK
jgi:hypothetical protein